MVERHPRKHGAKNSTVPEAARKKRDRRSSRYAIRPGTLAWTVAIFALTAVALSLASDLNRMVTELAAPPVTVASWPPAEWPVRPPTIRAVGEASPKSCPSEAGATAAAEEVARLESLVQELRLRNDLLRKYVDQKTGEAQMAAWKMPVLQEPSRSPGKRPRLPVAHTSTPNVQLIGSDALVSGTVRNPGPTDLGTRLEIELLLNGRRLKRRIVHLQLPAHGTIPYAESFPTSLADGTYSARVFLRL